MAKSYFDKLHADAFRSGVTPRTDESLKWFQKRLRSITRMNRNEILKDENLLKVNKPLTGRMFMYFYDPKTKETLPYYDKFPLIIMVDRAPKGFYGLNLHYLDPKRRAIFFDKLRDYMTNKKYDRSTKFRLSYGLLSGARKLKEFEPCFKRYLTSNIVSRVSEVPSTEWEAALFMPTDQFVKNKRQTVWNNSRKLIT
jgi:hypothetical protein